MFLLNTLHEIPFSHAQKTNQFKVDLQIIFNPLSANPTKWSNKLKQFVGKLPTNCLSVFDHFVGLVLQGLRKFEGRCFIILSLIYSLFDRLSTFT